MTTSFIGQPLRNKSSPHLFGCVFAERAHIVGRGCSTKDKVFYRECETHSYGANLEKMCFCSFELCNAAHNPRPLTLGAATLILTKLNTLFKHTSYMQLLRQLTGSWQLLPSCSCCDILLSCLFLLPLHLVFSRGVLQVTDHRPRNTANHLTAAVKESPSLPKSNFVTTTTTQGLQHRDQQTFQL